MTNNNIFKSYKQRLVQIDSRNSSFFLSVLRPKRHIDIVKLLNYFNSPLNIEKDIINTNLITIQKPELDKKLLTEAFLSPNYEKNVKNIIPVIEKIDFIKFSKIEKDKYFNLKFEVFIKDIINKYDNLFTRELKAFNGVEKETKNIFRTIGKDDLYLGYPFVEGKFESNREFRGPLVLHRVNIKKTNSGFDIEVVDSGKLINPVFLLSNISESGMKHKKFDYEIPDGTRDFVKYAIEYLKNENIKIETDTFGKQIEIESITKTLYREKYDKPIGKFDLMNYCVLGLFPVSDRNIYNDIDYLEKNSNNIPKSLNQFLSGHKEYEPLIENEFIPSEHEIKYISPIDSSQRIVIKNALNNNLVIEGPPGTGKSQTIVNLIVNLLLQNKKILVVSEKLAAIDVIYNRLGKLKENTLIIKDYLRNKEDFFRQIRETEKSRQQFNYLKYNKHIDEDIQKYFDNLKIINSSNYWEDKNFDEVYEIIKENSKKDNFSNYDEVFLKYINEIKNDEDIEEHTYRILTKENIKIVQEYNEIKDNSIFKFFKIKELLFFKEQLARGYTKEQIEYNYHLMNSGLDLIVFDPKNSDLNKGEVTPKNFKYLEVDKQVNEVFNRIIKYEESLKHLNSLNNKIIKKNMNLLYVIVDWNNLSEKRKKIKIKKALNEKYSYSFISKLFNKKVVLTSDEQEIFDYLNNYYELIDLHHIETIIKEFFPIDVFVSAIFLNNKENDLNKEKLLVIYFNNQLIKFNNSSFDYKFKKFKTMEKDIDFNILKNFKSLNEKDITLIEIYEKTNFNIGSFVDYLNYLKIGQEKITEVQEVVKYFNEKNRPSVSDIIDSKYSEVERYVYQYVKNATENELKTNKKTYNDYFGGLLHNANLQRKKSVKMMFDTFLNPLLAIYPVMLMTPEVVSSVFPMNERVFDYVIFDEASQMFIERAVPSIYRANRVIVAGDSQQLKPSSLFKTRLTEDDNIYYEDDITTEELLAFDKESLLEMSKSKYNSRMLKYHYRSEHKELIEFSSAAFYDNELIFSSMNGTSTFKAPISVITVDGFWSSDRVNEVEAYEVVEKIKHLLVNRKHNETIGVITFNITQKELIENMLEELNDQTINDEMQRTNPETGDDESLFVKNIENVQGDERDIIIFSVGYARNKHNRMNAHFGSLSQVGGENRLNVAITRAKKKIYIIKSFMADELYLPNKENVGPIRFKQYLEFAEFVDLQYKTKNNDERELYLDKKENLLNSISVSKNIYNQDSINVGFDSPFEEEFYNEIIKVLPTNKYLITNQVNVGNYYIDFGIYDKKTEKFLLGIECDGYQYHSKPEDVERDFFRQKYLESRGWNIHRVVSTNWFSNKEKEIEEVLLRLNIIENSNKC